MKVKLIGWTFLDQDALYEDTPWTPARGRKDTNGPTWPDALSEFAGRACYESWNRPNPDTAYNKDYLAHILEVGHESVLEHANLTFYVKEVSRALLLELERHRHLSFSVRSQRFVAEDNCAWITPPAIFGDETNSTLLAGAVQHGRAAYSQIVANLEEKGYTRKQAREAARAALPNAVETRFVVTGNLRAWRYVIKLRNSPHADAEIRQFAQWVLMLAKTIAPHAFQDMEVESCESRPPLSPA